LKLFSTCYLQVSGTATMGSGHVGAIDAVIAAKQ